jgi:hypothetical protein
VPSGGRRQRSSTSATSSGTAWERDWSPGTLYGAHGPIERSSFEQDLPGEKHQFRIIVPPEDGHVLDLDDFVRRYMKEVEKDPRSTARVGGRQSLQHRQPARAHRHPRHRRQRGPRSAWSASTSRTACGTAPRTSPPRHSGGAPSARASSSSIGKPSSSATHRSTARSSDVRSMASFVPRPA